MCLLCGTVYIVCFSALSISDFQGVKPQDYLGRAQKLEEAERERGRDRQILCILMLLFPQAVLMRTHQGHLSS